MMCYNLDMNDKKPIYKRWWFGLIIAFLAVGIFTNLLGYRTNTDRKNDGSYTGSSSQNGATKSDGYQTIISGICDDGTNVERVEIGTACEGHGRLVDWYYPID